MQNRTFSKHVMEAFDIAKKARTHKLCEKHPLLAAILALVIPTATIILVSSVADKISVNAGYLGMVIASVAVMLLYKAWFSPGRRYGNSVKRIFSFSGVVPE